jgi:formylglycine-generating enzyme required for sulfatase activity
MHLGFQEYLAASEVRRRASEGDAGPLRELAAQYGVSWWQEVILGLLSMGNPSMFERLLREVVQQQAFGETLEPMGLMLEDAVEVSEAPFVELLGEPPVESQGLWRRQLHALLILERMDAQEAIQRLREQLSQHPFEELRARFAVPPRAVAAAGGIRTLVHEKAGIELVRVPAGTFWMGSLEGQGEDREQPRHEVRVSEFELGKHPVTNEQYARFLQANPNAPEPKYWAYRDYNQARQPVVGVSWEQAQAFAEWTGLRLPTEAEWEYACRAGSVTQYSAGDTEEDLARVGWFGGNSEGRAHEVGEKSPNAFGLYDLHGNVWEWCSDWDGPYRKEAVVDPTGPGSGDFRILRGGSWNFPARFARSAYRRGYVPAVRYNNFGFRLARGPRTRE